jgi:hypothetical protein
MNLYDVRLDLVKVEEIRGVPFEPSFEDDGEDGYDARFHVAISRSPSEIELDDYVDVRVKLQTSINDGSPFFEISVIGTFQVITPEGVSALATREAPYELGSLLYPYLRNVAKPLLELLGANSIDFPYAPPQAPPKKKPATRKKKIAPPV